MVQGLVRWRVETDCPGTNYNFDGTAITGYDCYTADGWRFVGFSEYEEYSSYWRLHIEGRIAAPDGRAVYGAGSISEEISGHWVTPTL